MDFIKLSSSYLQNKHNQIYIQSEKNYHPYMCQKAFRWYMKSIPLEMKNLIFQLKQKFKISIWMRKICENTGFPWLVFARITIESMILSLHSK